MNKNHLEKKVTKGKVKIAGKIRKLLRWKQRGNWWDKIPQCGELSAYNVTLSWCLRSHQGGLDAKFLQRSPNHQSLIRPLGK